MYGSLCNEDLARSLPLPLAKLYRRAHNAKAPTERHNAACYLWEAALKLLGSVAVMAYADHPDHDAELIEALKKLARPSLGEWWSLTRRLVPILADSGDAGFRRLRVQLLDRKPRGDLPQVAELDLALGEALGTQEAARGTVRLADVFDRLIRYRNRELGHGAAGLRQGEFYEAMGRTMLAGVAELLDRIDVLAGRRLIYIDEVRLQKSGSFLIDRYLLAGESARRLESLERLASTPDAGHYRPGQVYAVRPELTLQEEHATSSPTAELPPPSSLRPLVVYEPRLDDILFLNARRTRQRCEYLCYTTGMHEERAELEGEHRRLMAQVLGVEFDEGTVESWTPPAPPPTVVDEDQGAEGIPPVACSGRRIGEFELLSELGHGNMGKVYRAWQPSLGRQVALKMISRADDPRARARFHREIRALGRVDHPHLVKIFTSGFDEDPSFYTMELVEGVTMAAICERLHVQTTSASCIDLETWQASLSTACEDSRRSEKPVGGGAASNPPSGVRQSVPGASSPPTADRGYVRQVVELVRQTALAADALHLAGVIHRDIKPGNIMVLADGSQAVLMDLGLAQLADDVDGRLTRTRQFVGTLRYASPEQVLSVGEIDCRSDVYSLGATLWELLTLHPLYGADESTPTPELMRRITSVEADRIRKYHIGIPRDLESIVAKCLEKDPMRRYATAGALANDLLHWQRGELVSAQPLTTRYVLGKFVRRNRVWFAAALLLGLLVNAGIAFEFWSIEKSRHGAEMLRAEAEANAARAIEANLKLQAALKDVEARRAEAVLHHKEAETARTQAEKSSAEAKRSAEKSEAVNDFLRHLLSHADPVENALEHRVSVEEVLDRALVHLSQTLADRPEHELEIRTTIVETYHSLGQDHKAERLLRQVISDRRRIQGAEHPDTLKALEQHAIVLIDLGRAIEAEPQLRKVVDDLRRIEGPEHPDTLSAMSSLATALRDLGRPEEAEPLLRKVVEVRTRTLGAESLETLASINSLAILLGESLDKPEEAERLFRKLVEDRKRIQRPDHPDTLRAIENLSLLLIHLGRPAEAESLLFEVVEDRRRLQGADHADTLAAVDLLARALTDVGKPAESETMLRRLVADRRRVQGPDHPETLSAINHLAWLLIGTLDRADEAEPLFRQVVESRKRTQGPNHPATFDSLENLAGALSRQGKLREAEPLLRQAFESRRRVQGEEHPRTHAATQALTENLLDQSDAGQAESLLRELLSVRRSVAREPLELARTLSALGWALTDNGKPKDAEPVLREALQIRRSLLPEGRWERAQTESLLGACLTKLGRYDDAEPLLLNAYSTMKKAPGLPPLRVQKALDRIVAHYDARQKREEAEHWRALRAELNVPDNPPPR